MSIASSSQRDGVFVARNLRRAIAWLLLFSNMPV
jgi:hypothetical protein